MSAYFSKLHPDKSAIDDMVAPTMIDKIYRRTTFELRRRIATKEKEKDHEPQQQERTQD